MTEDVREKIGVLIESRLAYTNGWRIPDDDYTAKCSEVANEILALFEKEREGMVEKNKELVRRTDEHIEFYNATKNYSMAGYLQAIRTALTGDE